MTPRDDADGPHGDGPRRPQARRTARPAAPRPGADAAGPDQPQPGPRAARVPRPGPSAGSGSSDGSGRSRAAGTPRPRRSRPVSRTPAPRPSRPRGPRAVRLGAARPRLRLVGVVLTLVMAVFVVRLLQVQAVDASAYAAKAAVNRWVTHEVTADRGTITDRSGVDLATTVDAFDITADPYLFTPAQAKVRDAPQQAAQLLAPIVGGDATKIARQLATPGSRYQIVAQQQSPQAWNQIQDLKSTLAAKAAAGQGADVLAGIFDVPHSKRVYPAGDLAAGVIGFVNSDGQGAGGLESMLDKELAGQNGKIRYAQSDGRQVPTAGSQEQPAVPGTDVQLTLDRDIQWAAQSAITKQVQKSQADRGYVVVQDPRTGQVLAMADAPGFNANDLSHADPDALGNAAMQDAYEPGSVSKLMSMSAIIDTGSATPTTRITVPGTLPRADRIFHDDVDHGTWYLTLNGVLAKSSNIGTIEASGQLGKTQQQANQVLYSYLRKFGIGQPTGVGFPGETPGILAKPQDWNASQQYTIPFGQGLSLNALQATSVYSTIANGGVRVEPSLIRGTTGPDGRFVPAAAPKKTRVVSTKTASTVSQMLESVVGSEQGTGINARIDGYRVAGKTGTANRVDPATGRYKGYTSSFMGFAPADKPRVTISCVIQNPTKGSYFGGDICGPVFKQVMQFALKSLGVAPSGSHAPQLPVTWDPSDPATTDKKVG
ncbi:peptidoglycan synthetase FtsI [Actinacidiphila yanglinensis]|uniref:Peptidoglycan synthetase FtsI n=1 Tax=Actinacidiphila yanglinensis TaxID=310779 RepID=A0A1H5TLC5_9ACTN|nr:peptidoglycan synthetase FtsI [Actinacidiphila yanglinensis]